MKDEERSTLHTCLGTRIYSQNPFLITTLWGGGGVRFYYYHSKTTGQVYSLKLWLR